MSWAASWWRSPRIGSCARRNIARPQQGDPELVIASDPRLQAESGNFATALLQQIHARRSELEQEQAQLSIEHGPNFPRVVEIRRLLQDLDRQKQAEDAKLVERFRSAWQTAADREQLVRKNLDELTAEGMKANEAATQYAAMREEANASHELYVRVLEKVEEAGLAAGIQGSNISVVDYARQPDKPVAPDLPLYMAITLFAGLWLAIGGAFLMESIRPSSHPSTGRAVLALLAAVLAGASVHAQAPTPSTSGLPTGVVRLPSSQRPQILPNPKEAPVVWDGASQTGLPPMSVTQSATPMPAPIAPGDFLDVSEVHTPEFHSAVRVSPSGTVTLPMIHEVQVGGLDEQGAAHAIEAALMAQGMLLHPLVSVLVISYAGQDVSVLGEVVRPGVYPYTLHHRLLDLISAASGLSPSAGRLVNVFHRDDAKTPHPVVLDPSGTDTAADHNPELAPGDTVQVSRAGLVYVVGDVQRPGGFPVDPAQGLTVVQALSLAWGPTQNAAIGKALLIREQKGGRTLTSLNLKRMLHGQEPDQPVHDRDILYVPDSAARNLWNRTMESAIQSAIGVTIYSAPGLFAEVLMRRIAWVLVAALRLRDSLGVLPGPGRTAGQHRPSGWLAVAAGGDSRCFAGRPPARSRTDAVAGAGLLSLVLLHLLLDHRAAGYTGQDARLLPGDDDCLAGVGVCRERRRPARAVAGNRGRLLGAGPADNCQLCHSRGGCQRTSPLCRRRAGPERRGALSRPGLSPGGAAGEQRTALAVAAAGGGLSAAGVGCRAAHRFPRRISGGRGGAWGQRQFCWHTAIRAECWPERWLCRRLPRCCGGLFLAAASNG